MNALLLDSLFPPHRLRHLRIIISLLRTHLPFQSDWDTFERLQQSHAYRHGVAIIEFKK